MLGLQFLLATRIEEHAMSITYRARAAVLAAFGIAFAAPLTANAQAIIKVNDSVSVRFGILSQTWVDYSQTPNVFTDGSYTQDIFLRRMRFLFTGQIGSKLSFLFQTDNPNLGRTGVGFVKSPATGFFLQDGYLEYQPATNIFILEAGLHLVPNCRNCITNAAQLLPIDYSIYSFLQGPQTVSSVGRDLGITAKGNFLDQKVQYRVGAFSGARLPAVPTTPLVQQGSNSLRSAGRLMVNFMDPEPPTYTLPGTYFGRKKVFNLGAGFDTQSRYKAISGDGFLSYPLGANGTTIAATYIYYNGGTFFPTLPKQNTYEAEGAFHFTAAKLTPWVKLEWRRFDEGVKTTVFQNDRRLQFGGTYYASGHNINVKAAYTRATFDQLLLPKLNANSFTLQLQGFYY
jgi:hypothetical protein